MALNDTVGQAALTFSASNGICLGYRHFSSYRPAKSSRSYDDHGEIQILVNAIVDDFCALYPYVRLQLCGAVSEAISLIHKR